MLEAGRAELEAIPHVFAQLLPQVRRLLVVAALCAVVLAPIPAAAAPTVIDFEGVPTGAELGSQYAGVTFSNAKVSERFGGYAHSGSKFAEACTDVDQCFDPLRMDFSEGKYRFRAFVGLDRTPSSPLTVELRLWSRDLSPLKGPTVLARVRHTFPASSTPAPIRQEMSATAASNSYFAADFRILEVGQNDGVVIDDVEFERGEAQLTFTPNPVDFGDVDVDGGVATRTVTVTNTGEVTTTPREAFVDGTDRADFAITSEACTSRLLAPGAQCPVDLAFDPGGEGSKTARLVVTRSGVDPPESVPLLGAGTVTTTSGGGDETTASTGGPTTTSGTTATTGTTLPSTATTIVVPPTTPGATLEVAPALGTPGFVTVARGTGFAPGTVELTWLPGLGVTQTEVGPDGSFVEQVLIMPNDRLGRRTLVATGAATTATTDFLVVARSVKPSGTDVSHINRSRRYNNR